MDSAAAARALDQLQSGYRTVPLFPATEPQPLAISLIVRDFANPTAGVFVLLRDTFDASIYLGCLADAEGYIHEWLEVWVQNVNNTATQFESLADTLTNHTLDERWKKRVAVFGRLERPSLLALPSLSTSPRPIFFDLAVTAPVHPTDAKGNTCWSPCRDDALLTRHGLPPYTTSLARYLHLPGGATGEIFLPVTDGAPENDSTRPLADTLGPLIPFNPAGGLTMIRRFAPFSFEAYLELLGGRPWTGIEQGEKVFKLDGVYRTLLNEERIRQGYGYLRWAERGESARLLEVYTLKLDLLLQCFQLVRKFVQDEQLPFLNLTAESFRVRLGEIGSSLPFFWTGKAELARPGGAVALSLPASEARYFAVPGPQALSVYRSSVEAGALASTGSVRLRQVVFGEDGSLTAEGTISTREKIAAAPSDLLSLRLTVSAGRVDLYGHLVDGLARGEMRFRTLPLRLPPVLQPALRSAEGVTFSNVPIAALPLLGSSSDLYSLGVASVRALLVNDDNSLAIALDELLSLAQIVAENPNASATIADGVRAAAAANPRWSASLGPQRLVVDSPPDAAACYAHLPADLWWETIACLLQCFPGSAEVANSTSLDAIFDGPIQRLETLIRRARSLLVGDVAADAEIHALLTRTMELQLSESKGEAAA